MSDEIADFDNARNICAPAGVLEKVPPDPLGATCRAPLGLPSHFPPCEGLQRTDRPTLRYQSPVTSTSMLSSGQQQQQETLCSTFMLHSTQRIHVKFLQTWSTLGCAPSSVLAGGSLLMKLPSSMGNWVKGCGGPLGAGGGCGRGPGPGPLCWPGPGAGAFVSSPGPFACTPGAGCSGPWPGPPCMGLACCVGAGLL